MKATGKNSDMQIAVGNDSEPQPAIQTIGNGSQPATKFPETSRQTKPRIVSPFDDMAQLRKQNQAAFKGEREGSSAVDLAMPVKELYVRFHPDNDYYLPSMVWSPTADRRRLYYVASSLWDLEDLQGGLRAVILAPWLGAGGEAGIWAASASESARDWYTSAQEIITVGRGEWIRVQSDMSAGKYRYFRPEDPVPDCVFR
jgi:hypothetical protein